MNPSGEKGVMIEVSASDFLDRCVINAVRLRKLNAPAPAPWVVDQMNEATALAAAPNEAAGHVRRLEEIHLKIWDLETLVRAAKTDAEFCAIARKLFELNDQRHQVKAEIDRCLPTRCAARRIYDNPAT